MADNKKEEMARTCGDCAYLMGDIMKNENEKKTLIVVRCLAKMKTEGYDNSLLKTFVVEGLSVDNKTPKYNEYPEACETHSKNNKEEETKEVKNKNIKDEDTDYEETDDGENEELDDKDSEDGTDEEED